MTKLYFIRHCEAEGNTRGVLQGRADSDVSGNSAKQLDLVALRLRNVPFTAVYSSPLRRAYKTALAIDRYHHLGVIKDERLIEIDMGSWEGRSWANIEQESPAMLRVWNEDPGEFIAPDGESIRQVSSRMWAAAADIARAHDGETVCVVSHGCAIRSLLCRALRKPLSAMNEVPWCDNTGVSVIEFDGNTAHVAMMNDASHIPPELSVYRSADSKDDVIMDVAP